MGDVYKKEYRIRYYETDFDKRLRTNQWLNFFQDAAICHGEQVGRGLDFLDDHDLLWVLMEWDIDIVRYPVCNEMICVITMQHSSNGLYCKRLYEVYDDEGKCIAKAVSIWMMLQKSTFKIIKVPEYVITAYGGKVDRKSYKRTEKLQEYPANDETVILPLQVRVSDLDSNNHVNNEKYLEWSIREVPFELYRKLKVHKIRINYLKSTFYADQLHMNTNLVKVDDAITIKQSVKNESGETICLIELGMAETQPVSC